MSDPRPNDRNRNSIIVASVTYRDLDDGDRQYLDEHDDWPDLVYLLLLLNPQPPYFTVAHVNAEGVRLSSEDHHNIVPAVRSYEENGGDY